MVADLSARGLLPDLSSADTVTYRVETGEDVGTERWQPALALLQNVADIALPVSALPDPSGSMCVLTVQVQPAGAQPYVTTLRQGFRTAERRAQIAVIGTLLPVLIDPSNPLHITFDVGRFDASR
jgi:hypothetical protein